MWDNFVGLLQFENGLWKYPVVSGSKKHNYVDKEMEWIYWNPANLVISIDFSFPWLHIFKTCK